MKLYLTRKDSALCVLICFISINVRAQFLHKTGLRPDDGSYDRQPRKVEMITRDYQVLPTRYSLLQYCPEVKSQSSYGTCAAWASAYAARTIAEAIKYGWTNIEKITEEAFSPIYLYALTKDEDDKNCQDGLFLHKAIKHLKEHGVPKYHQFDVLCADYVNNELKASAYNYRIDDYFTLFSHKCSNHNEKISKVKKAIFEECPVVIAMKLPTSFDNVVNYWDGFDIDPSNHGYHAMCAIGYDNDINGGSFQIMNSWGKQWGNNGFVWVKYEDFAKYVDQAYEFFVRKLPDSERTPLPSPKPINEKTNHFSGEIELQLSTGDAMLPIKDKSKAICYYKIKDQYISRTRYRVYVTNNEPAYVYIIGSDLRNNVSKVFPPNNSYSAALTYKSNHIAIPDETYFIELDENKGTDYMCILYSKYELDINSTATSIKNSYGSFYDKVNNMSDKLVPITDITCKSNKISFEAESNKTIVAIVVEISHK